MPYHDITRRPDGCWHAATPGGSRANAVRRTQTEFYEAARRLAPNSGTGELETHGRDGRIRTTNTLGKPVPHPPLDRRP